MEKLVERLLDSLDKKDQIIIQLVESILYTPISVPQQSFPMEAFEPLTQSDEEEDLKWMQKEGIIDTAELEDKLKEMRFMNANIEVN